MSKFAVGDHVRLKFGVNRGLYGTVIHIGGDDGTFYGIQLDGEPECIIGYFEYELDKDVRGEDQRTDPQHSVGTEG